MVVSSVSPERWEITAVYPARLAISIGVERFGQRADLVHLDQDGVADAFLDAPGQAARCW